MRRSTLLTLLAFRLWSHATEVAANHMGNTQQSVNNSIAKVLECLSDKLFSRTLQAMPMHCVGLDDTMLGKASQLAMPTSRKAVFSTLHRPPVPTAGTHSFFQSEQQFRNAPKVVMKAEVEGAAGEAAAQEVGSSLFNRASTSSIDKKVAIVTGSSTGIGLATVEGMARSGLYGTIVLAGRNREKYELAIQDLKDRLGSVAQGLTLKYMTVELSSLKSVRNFAADFLNSSLPLHTVVLNAGVMAIPDRRTTEDGYECQFGVNHLSHFLLANLVLDRLVASASPADPARVISLSSAAHQIPSPLLYGDVGQLQLDQNNYNAWVAYGQSKLCNVLFAYELDRRCRSLGLPIAANAVHPGGVDTELARYIGGGSTEFSGPLQDLAKPFLSVARQYAIKTPEDGACTSVLLATTNMGKLSGRYWLDKRPAASFDIDPASELPEPAKGFLPVQPRLTSYNPETWSELWRESEKMSGLMPNEVQSWQSTAPGAVER